MSGPDTPPVASRLTPRARWAFLLVALSWPTILAVIVGATAYQPHLPDTLPHLLRFMFLEFTLWGIIFAAGFRISGITASQLRVVVRNPLKTIALGFAWFVATRLSFTLVFWIILRWIDVTAIWATEEKIAAFTDFKNISHHLTISIISFGFAAVLAGVTEELWRAGMLAGIRFLFPNARLFPTILVVSLLFAAGHLYQGWLGMLNALVLGIMLGSILVYRNSFWEAAIAHTMFDALSFGFAILMALNIHSYDPFIVSAAAKDNIPGVRHWVAMGGNINATFNTAQDYKNISALETAAGLPHPEMVHFLLENGADPNLADSHGRTALIAAAEQNQLPNLALLLAHGVKIDEQDNRGFTALRCATEYNHVAAARLLIDSSANLNIRDNHGLSPWTPRRNTDPPI